MPTVERLGPLYSQTNPRGLVNLQTHLLRTFPTARAGGMYNPSSNLSSGAPSPHRVTQAVDVMCDRPTAARIIRYMVSIADAVNLQQVIAWHEIITVQRWSQGIRNYPASDHSDGNGHAHIHVGLNASRNFDVSWIGGTHPQQPQPEEDDMTPDESRILHEIRNMLGDGAQPGVLHDINGMLHRVFDVNPADGVSALAVRVAGMEKMLGAIRDGVTGVASTRPGDTLTMLKDGVAEIVAAARKTLG